MSSISPAIIPSNHSGNITLTLSGTGTSWVQGTTNFTISGVSNVTKISQTLPRLQSSLPLDLELEH